MYVVHILLLNHLLVTNSLHHSRFPSSGFDRQKALGQCDRAVWPILRVSDLEKYDRAHVCVYLSVGVFVESE